MLLAWRATLRCVILMQLWQRPTLPWAACFKFHRRDLRGEVIYFFGTNNIILTGGEGEYKFLDAQAVL